MTRLTPFLTVDHLRYVMRIILDHVSGHTTRLSALWKIAVRRTCINHCRTVAEDIQDYRGAHGQDIAPFMNAASQIYELVAGQWDDTCGGGGARILSCCT